MHLQPQDQYGSYYRQKWGDTLTGGSSNDTITGGNGNDRIQSGDGSDSIDGGDGNDQINGYPTTGGAYTYWTYAGSKTINGGNGDDFIYGGDNADSLFGGTGNDSIYGSLGNDTIDGGNGDDFLVGGDGADSIVGGEGNDSFTGGLGDDLILAGAGDDYLDTVKETGNDTVYGGDGNDFFNFTNLEGNKLIFGENGNDSLNGGAGNDTLDGGAGNDTLYLGNGNDSVTGGDGDDQMYKFNKSGNGYFLGGNGNDTIQGGLGNDTIWGGDGNDSWLEGYEGDDSISGDAGNDKIYGDEGNDTLNGGIGNDIIYGGDGADKIFGNEGDDSDLDGGLGNDIISGGTGNDTIWGQAGNDSLEGGAGNDKVYGGAGNDTLIGGDGNDYLYDDGGSNYFDGGVGNDTVYGDSGNDTVIGGDGNDSVIGWSGDDSISGGDGEDYLSGGDGNDILDGGGGNDTLYGGSGNDTYYINSIFDHVYDSGGNDTAYVSTSFVKIPSSIEKINYLDGVQALPYWIDAMLPDEAAGLFFKNILGNSKIFNYIFPSTIPTYDTSAKHAVGYMGFTTTQISRTKEALSYISTLINLQFIPTSNAAQDNTIAFANNTQTDSAGYALYPDSDYFLASDVFLDKSSATTFTMSNGEYQTLTLIHEIGHALGLEHPFSSPGSTGTLADPPFLTGDEDSTTWTVMSYTDSPSQYYLQYSPLDIAALQYMYGPSPSSRTGNDTYKASQLTANFIWDGAGTDTVDISSVSLGSTVYLTPGYWGFIGSTKASKITAAGQITVNFGTKIENLIGSSYADKLYGNELSNSVVGGLGNDLLEGLDGNDTLVGGQGDDQIFGGAGIDIAQFNGLLSSYSISKIANSFAVSDRKTGQEGTDSLVSIERLKFSDKYIAFDLDANAGITAKVMGAVLGKDSIRNFTEFGYWLSQADNGLSYSVIGLKALDMSGLKTYDQIVSTLWKNVVGFTASESDKAPYIKMLNDGMKPGDLVVLAADTIFNTININLVGLTQTGIEYTPVI